MQNNIRKIRKEKKLTLEAIAEIVGTNAAMIQKLEKGERGLKYEWMIKLSKALNCKPEDLIAEPQKIKMIPIKGIAGAGGEIFCDGDDDGGYGEVECPIFFTSNYNDIVAVQVRGDSMFPVFQDGWVVYYTERRDLELPTILLQGGQVPYNPKGSIDDPLGDFINKPCIVKLRNGRTMLKTLKKGSEKGLYNLVSYNSPDMENMEVEWAAKIVFVKMD